jgi:hypothetical protein
LNTAVVRLARFKDAILKRLAFHGNYIKFDVFTAVLLVTHVFCWVFTTYRMLNSHRSSGMGIWKLLDPEDQGTKVFRNVG